MIMMADRKKTVAAILGPHPDMEKDEAPDALHMAAEEAIQCIHEKDAKGLVESLRAIFEELDSEPHHEGPHIED